MAKLKPTTIDLGGPSVQREGIAGGAITPGMLVRDIGGTISVHNAAGGVGPAAFAVENDMIGKGIEDAYALGDQVIYRVFGEGAGVLARLASGQNVAAGVYLQSNGAGFLTAIATADNAVAQAQEAVNATSGAALIRVRIVKGYTSA